MKDQILSVKDLTDVLIADEPTIWQWVSEGSFPKPMLARGKFARWRSSEVDQWARKHLKSWLCGQAKPISADLCVTGNANSKMDSAEQVPCNFRVSPEFRHRLKSFAVANEMSMVEVFTRAVDEYMKK
ncbi:AlpA family phage regulatory protein [Halomonas sp. XH26]|uniref:helix-turn-helix transcriptional regulator n=1 Tax=Halomonas sp. XH26 TaxID=2557993 RepID=UPI00209E2735|nr:AlpA family phage regulatory protein [Halomonas sp. XH26]UTA79009.1 AlpA family phage regulatory protein [Halomonas sp. XH26]